MVDVWCVSTGGGGGEGEGDDDVLVVVVDLLVGEDDVDTGSTVFDVGFTLDTTSDAGVDNDDDDDDDDDDDVIVVVVVFVVEPRDGADA